MFEQPAEEPTDKVKRPMTGSGKHHLSGLAKQYIPMVWVVIPGHWLHRLCIRGVGGLGTKSGMESVGSWSAGRQLDGPERHHTR